MGWNNRVSRMTQDKDVENKEKPWKRVGDGGPHSENNSLSAKQDDSSLNFRKTVLASSLGFIQMLWFAWLEPTDSSSKWQCNSGNR
jgi:hypothetical protein